MSSSPTPARALEAFDRIVDLPEGDQQAALRHLRQRDPSVARWVEQMLRADLGPALELEGAPGDLGSRAATGSQIGAWTVTREIGRGGMGVVFAAERSDGAFEQEVAVKVMAGWMPSEAGLLRMRQEAEILGRLEHPGIARIYDAGALSDGSPYLVMEKIDGPPLDEYCDCEGLGVPERLALFRSLCLAVDHAHRNLIVHRDIKPGNVLVAPDGTPKLVDFGIAKLMADGEVGSTATHLGGRPFTPGYASPEQFLGKPVTTQSDVFSMGVVLYELLVGSKPFAQELPAGDVRIPAETWRVEAPSRRIPASGERLEELLRARGGVRPGALRRQIGPELEAIVGQALHHDLERRYRSIAELAEDLERLDGGLPVRARPDTLAYRARKFVGRHRKKAFAGTAILLAIVVGVASTLWQARVAQRERDAARESARLAQEESNKARLTSEFLVSLFESADPSWYIDREAKGPETTILEVLEEASVRLDRDLVDAPLERASLHHSIGNSFRALGELGRARDHFRSSLELRAQHLPEVHRDLAEAYYFLGTALEYSDAEQARAVVDLWTEAHRIERALESPSSNYPFFLGDYSNLLWRIGDGAGSARVARELLAYFEHRPAERAAGPLDRSYRNLIQHALDRADFAGARELAAARPRLEGQDWVTPTLLWLEGDFEAAARAFRQEAARTGRDPSGSGFGGPLAWVARWAAVQSGMAAESTAAPLWTTRCGRDWETLVLTKAVQSLTDGSAEDLEEAMAGLDENYPQPSIARAVGWEALAEKAIEAGRPDSARQFLQRSREEWQREFGAGTPHGTRLAQRSQRR